MDHTIYARRKILYSIAYQHGVDDSERDRPSMLQDDPNVLLLEFGTIYVDGYRDGYKEQRPHAY